MSKADEARITLALSEADLNITINHEPRLLDVRLAEALGYERPADIRPLIERHKETLERFGAVIRSVRKNPRRGRPAVETWLNEEQALYLCTQSQTERASIVTVEMVRVFKVHLACKATEPATALPPPEEPKPEPAPHHKFWDLTAAASAAFNVWNAAGLVTDNDRAMWIAMQAVCDVAGVDARMEAAAGLKRRGRA